MKSHSTIVLFLIIFGVTMVPAFALDSPTNFQITPLTQAKPTTGLACGDHICNAKETPHFQLFFNQWQQYKTSQTFNGKMKIVFTPQSLDIVAPDGTCNITGIMSGQKCSVPQMVVSAATYNNMTTNPAIMAVININPTQAAPTTQYCDIANWIVNAEDGYTSNIVNETYLIDPPYCHNPNPLPVPEFSHATALIMMLSVLSIIIVSVRIGLKYKV